MGRMLRLVERSKKDRRLGEPSEVSWEEIEALELDPRVELIRQLIPLGLIQGDASARVRDVVELRRTDASVLPRRRGSSRRRGDRHRRPRVQGLVRRKARHAPARPLSARGRARRSRWSNAQPSAQAGDLVRSP